METKAQCLLDRIMDEVGYGHNYRLTTQVLNAFNAEKKYASDKIFINNENGLDEGLRGYSPSFIVYSLTNRDSEYDVEDPFFYIDGGICSLDAFDFERALDEESLKRVTGWDVVQFLDDSDCCDAFYTYVRENYPQQYKSMNFDLIDDYGTEEFFDADWDELAKSLMQHPVNEDRVLEMTEDELRQIVSEGATEAYKRIKEGKSEIHIKKSHEGKLTDLKNRTGKSESEIYNDGNPDHKRMVVFARNARKWHKK